VRATRRLLEELGSDDFPSWDRAVRLLARSGSLSAPALIDEMLRRAGDPEYCTRAGMVFKAMGPRGSRIVADAIERTDEPVPLQVLVEVIGTLGVKSQIYRLTDLIDRIEARRKDAEGNDSMQGVLAKAHLELARIGSRVAIDSLRQAIGDQSRPTEIELLRAVERIGKREEIGVLLAAYDREPRFVRETIASVVRTIVRREKIRRTNRIFRTMSSRQRAAFETILPRRVARRPSSRSPRPAPER
jgi:hypothetical protein